MRIGIRYTYHISFVVLNRGGICLTILQHEGTRMSQTHIRAKEEPPQRSKPTEAAIVAVFAFFGLLLAFGVYWEGFRSDRESLDAKIIDTRIAVTSLHESNYGTWAEYRIEARVIYDLHGQKQDRWVPVSEIVNDKTLLEARLATHPTTCEISWTRSHPENARCQLPRP
jgi:hypothetical protein